MGVKGWFIGIAAALLLAGCGGDWKVAYPENVSSDVSKNWRSAAVISVVPETLSVSNANTYAPSADIVWWGEPFGDRRAQVARILEESVTAATSDLKGGRPVTFTITATQFHAVTPISVATAPAAVHNIAFTIQVFDARSAEPLTPPIPFQADLEAYTREAATASAIQGGTQRRRIVDHLTAVVKGWLSFGPDQRRTFQSLGR